MFLFILVSTYKFKRHFFRHGHRTAPKFGTHVRIETRLALTKKINPAHPRGVIGGYLCVWVATPTMMWDDVVLWDVCGFFRHDRRTAPKFCTHVRRDTLTLKKIQNLTHPTPGGFRGLSIVKIFRWPGTGSSQKTTGSQSVKRKINLD